MNAINVLTKPNLNEKLKTPHHTIFLTVPKPICTPAKPHTVSNLDSTIRPTANHHSKHSLSNKEVPHEFSHARTESAGT